MFPILKEYLGSLECSVIHLFEPSPNDHGMLVKAVGH